MELVNKVHKRVIMLEEMNAPITIDNRLYHIFKLESPAIILPAQTPVSGNGIATKPVNARYFLKFVALLSRVVLFLIYLLINLFVQNPVALFFNCFVIRIIKILGKSEPKNDKNNAPTALNALFPQKSVFIASGIAILLSRVGHADTRRTASHTQF